HPAHPSNRHREGRHGTIGRSWAVARGGASLRMTRHGHHRVTAARVVGTYMIEVAFSDGLRREIDLSEVLWGELYGPLRDPVVFGQVSVDPEAHTVTWPIGADCDPGTL